MVLDLAIKHKLEDLLKKSLALIRQNFGQLSHAMLPLSFNTIHTFASDQRFFPGQISPEALLAFLARWVAVNPPEREVQYSTLLHCVSWSNINDKFLCNHIDGEHLYQASPESLFNVLQVALDKNQIYLGQKYQDMFQDLQEKLLPDQDLDELNDSNSFLSQAINSAVKDLEHTEMDPDWFLQNDEQGQRGETASNANNTNVVVPVPSTSKDNPQIEFDIVEQVINEQRMSEQQSSTSFKRYDPKFRALNEAFRQDMPQNNRQVH